jgi:DNA-binding XRE family transcriptional regulator
MNQGKNVRMLRQLSDLKQWQLAKMINVTSQRMSVIEQTPVLELELKIRIANALNTTIEEIEGGGRRLSLINHKKMHYKKDTQLAKYY